MRWFLAATLPFLSRREQFRVGVAVVTAFVLGSLSQLIGILLLSSFDGGSTFILVMVVLTPVGAILGYMYGGALYDKIEKNSIENEAAAQAVTRQRAMNDIDKTTCFSCSSEMEGEMNCPKCGFDMSKYMKQKS